MLIERSMRPSACCNPLTSTAIPSTNAARAEKSTRIAVTPIDPRSEAGSGGRRCDVDIEDPGRIGSRELPRRVQQTPLVRGGGVVAVDNAVGEMDRTNIDAADLVDAATDRQGEC